MKFHLESGGRYRYALTIRMGRGGRIVRVPAEAARAGRPGAGGTAPAAAGGSDAVRPSGACLARV